MKADILAFLGLMRRASALAIGEENASEAIGKGKARLLLLPSDGREKTALHAEHLLEGRSALKILLLFYGSRNGSRLCQGIGAAVGRRISRTV